MVSEPTDPWPQPFEPMEEDSQLLERFRRVAASFAAVFTSRRDHVLELLGSAQNYSSGLFREGLLRDFLREILPRGVDVDPGFIYGFEKVPNSAQLDIIVWDSVRHAPVYRTDSFVVVTPESVIAVISVKTRMQPKDLKEAADNLRSVTPLDLAYRAGLEPPLPPISKFIVTFDGSQDPASLGRSLAEHIQTWFTTDQRLVNALIPVLAALEPTDPSREHGWQVDREFPRLIVSLASSDGCSFIRGWGPGVDELVGGKYGVRRLPYLYRLRSSLTTSFEKFVYHLLTDVYRALDTRGWSLVAAWGDMHPRWGFRMGDASEIVEHAGYPLLDLTTSLKPQSVDEGNAA